MKEKSVKEHMASIAPRGGKATLKKYGPKHFAVMAKNRWAGKKQKVNAK